MTDRELLELAAKAARFKWDENFLCYLGEPDVFGLSAKWEPLTDDGDALRLAVKLEIDLEFDFDSHECIATRSDLKVKFRELSGLSPKNFAATRRAIVRAAAAIGEAM